MGLTRGVDTQVTAVRTCDCLLGYTDKLRVLSLGYAVVSNGTTPYIQYVSMGHTNTQNPHPALFCVENPVSSGKDPLTDIERKHTLHVIGSAIFF